MPAIASNLWGVPNMGTINFPTDGPVVATWLDLTASKCPLNFVQTCLALEKLEAGQVLGVVIAADGQSAMNIPNSIAQEGHTVVHQQPVGSNAEQLALWVEKK